MRERDPSLAGCAADDERLRAIEVVVDNHIVHQKARHEEDVEQQMLVLVFGVVLNIRRRLRVCAVHRRCVGAVRRLVDDPTLRNGPSINHQMVRHREPPLQALSLMNVGVV